MPEQKFVYILWQTFRDRQKGGLHSIKLVFVPALNAVNVNNFLVWHKKFGPAQNILGPVKGQGISVKTSGRFFLILWPSHNIGKMDQF